MRQKCRPPYRMLWISLWMMKVQTLKKSPSDLDSQPVTEPQITHKFRTLHLVFFVLFCFFFLHKVRQRFVWVAGVSWGQAEWQVSLSLRYVLISQCTANVTLYWDLLRHHLMHSWILCYHGSHLSSPLTFIWQHRFFKGAKKSGVFLSFFCRTYFFPLFFLQWLIQLKEF